MDFPAPLTPGELIARVAARLGLRLHFESPARASGQIATADGRKFYFAGTRMDLNGIVAAELAEDKAATAYYLLRLGYRVPEGRAFPVHVVDEIRTYARELGFPVVVKPTNGASGAHVSIAADELQLERALAAMAAHSGYATALIQRQVSGNDYRLIVLDGDVLAAYQRVPLTVHGDGQRTLEQHLANTIGFLTLRKRHLNLVPRDLRVALRIEQLGLDWQTVLPAGRSLQLLETANGSTGGDLVDYTTTIHADVRALARRVARDAGLRYCGLDLMTASIEQPLADYAIIELNASPAIFHLLGLGTHEQQLAESIIERMLLAMTEGPPPPASREHR